MNASAILVGENGEANKEKQKCLNACVPSKTPLLVLLVISRLLQLITPIE